MAKKSKPLASWSGGATIALGFVLARLADADMAHVEASTIFAQGAA